MDTTSDSARIVQALRERRNKRVRKLLARMHPAKLAALVETMDHEDRHALWQQVGPELEARVLSYLPAALARQLAVDPARDGSGSDEAGRAGDVENPVVAVREALLAGSSSGWANG